MGPDNPPDLKPLADAIPEEKERGVATGLAPGTKPGKGGSKPKAPAPAAAASQDKPAAVQLDSVPEILDLFVEKVRTFHISFDGFLGVVCKLCQSHAGPTLTCRPQISPAGLVCTCWLGSHVPAWRGVGIRQHRQPRACDGAVVIRWYAELVAMLRYAVVVEDPRPAMQSASASARHWTLVWTDVLQLLVSSVLTGSCLECAPSTKDPCFATLYCKVPMRTWRAALPLPAGVTLCRACCWQMCQACLHIRTQTVPGADAGPRTLWLSRQHYHDAQVN